MRGTDCGAPQAGSIIAAYALFVAVAPRHQLESTELDVRARERSRYGDSYTREPSRGRNDGADLIGDRDGDHASFVRHLVAPGSASGRSGPVRALGFAPAARSQGRAGPCDRRPRPGPRGGLVRHVRAASWVGRPSLIRSDMLEGGAGRPVRLRTRSTTSREGAPDVASSETSWIRPTKSASSTAVAW